MGSCSCTRRHFLLSICFLQVITIVERQVFDFLGYMWAPILVNFFHILFIIFGFYGAYHFRVKYIITYLIWNFLWIGWNAFLICFYLNVGQLDRDSDLLNLGTGSVSWFEANGYGCRPTYNMTSDDPFRPQRPERVEDCLLDYPLVETVHAGVQCALALLGILGAILISCIFLDEDDRFDFMNGDAKSPQHTVVHPMYVSYTSIPTTSASATMQSNKHLQLQQNSLKLYHHHAAAEQLQQQQPKLHQFHTNNSSQNNNNSQNYLLSGGSSSSNNNTLLNHNLRQRANSLLPLSPDTTNNQSASFQQQASNHNPHLTPSNSSSLRRHRHHHNNPYHFATKGAPISPSPMSAQTTPSLSYASLQNSNPYLAGGGGNTSLSNSNYSIFQSPDSIQGSSSISHFARIHHKPKPPKTAVSGLSVQGGLDSHLTSPVRPLERLSRNLEEDEDNFSLQQFAPGDHGVTYVPFQSPTPNGLFLGENNNSQPHSAVFHLNSRSSSSNNNAYPYEQNGLPSPLRLARRPTQIPLPTVPMHSCLEMDHHEDEEADGEDEAGEIDRDQVLTPPPPPVPRPHIFHQRLGQAPYPDLSPEVAERYAMPTQLGPTSVQAGHGLLPVPHGSPMVRRSNRRARPPIPVNFCDQIRAPPPGYVVRAQSDDRLVEQSEVEAEAAPHVNRRSGRNGNGQKSRPRSFCNSIVVKHISKQSKHRQSLYSIEFGGSSSDTIRHGHSMALGLGDPRGEQDGGGELSPKPMTPRRVKRRSVMARGTQGRQSSGGGSSSRRSHHGSSGTLRSKHGHSGHGGGADSSSGSYVRSSTRSSRRKYHQNPVTKIIDQQLQQHQQLQQQPHLGSFHRQQQQDKLSLTASNLQSLNDDIVNNTNISGSQLGSLGKNNRHYYHSYRKNIPLDPIYYNTNGQGAVLEEPSSPTLPPPPPLPLPAPASSSILQVGGGGHYNPSYQHSTTHLNDVGHAPDEMYNNRPPSVRSSYSNFHGSRPLSTAYGNAPGENVFAGLNGASASPPQAPCTPPLYQQHPMHMQQQQQHYLPPPPMDPAPAYVSAMSFSKRTASRESIRSMAFLNNGPPAYNLNYHTPPDSETTM